jgi:Zn-dependent M28 family amino/carboxypeptidase
VYSFILSTLLVCILISSSNAYAVEAESISLESVVGALSGADEISAGIQITDRYSVANRRIVRTYLGATLSQLGLTPLAHDYGTGENTFARVVATKNVPKPALVLGAHFDSVSRSPGANDNATGIAMVFGVVAALKSLPCRSRDVIIVFFDEEERGLIGSRNFASFLKTSGEAIHSVHTIDQVGWDKDGDRAIELELPTRELEQLYRQVAASNGFTMPLHRTSTSSTDHSSFRRAGFAAVGITEEYVNGDTTPHYHRASDTFETVDFAYLEHSTAFVSAVFGNLVACE